MLLKESEERREFLFSAMWRYPRGRKRAVTRTWPSQQPDLSPQDCEKCLLFKPLNPFWVSRYSSQGWLRWWCCVTSNSSWSRSATSWHHSHLQNVLHGILMLTCKKSGYPGAIMLERPCGENTSKQRTKPKECQLFQTNLFQWTQPKC